MWRHAEAADARDGQDDLERALTAKGERQALRVADWLNQHLPAGTRILVSPAKRTQQTAATLERKIRTEPALAPDASVDALLAAVRWPQAKEPVLVVGHQPTLGHVASMLLAGEPLDWTVRKGGVWWLRGRERDGELQVVVHAVMAPEIV